MQEWFEKELDMDSTWIFIIFEHSVFLMMFVITLIIPNVPIRVLFKQFVGSVSRFCHGSFGACGVTFFLFCHDLFCFALLFHAFFWVFWGFCTFLSLQADADCSTRSDGANQQN
jgi:hypothetical protein